MQAFGDNLRAELALFDDDPRAVERYHRARKELDAWRALLKRVRIGGAMPVVVRADPAQRFGDWYVELTLAMRVPDRNCKPSQLYKNIVERLSDRRDDDVEIGRRTGAFVDTWSWSPIQRVLRAPELPGDQDRLRYLLVEVQTLYMHELCEQFVIVDESGNIEERPFDPHVRSYPPPSVASAPESKAWSELEQLLQAKVEPR